jgi:hypothetical protein
VPIEVWMRSCAVDGRIDNRTGGRPRPCAQAGAAATPLVLDDPDDDEPDEELDEPPEPPEPPEPLESFEPDGAGDALDDPSELELLVPVSDFADALADLADFASALLSVR